MITIKTEKTTPKLTDAQEAVRKWERPAMQAIVTDDLPALSEILPSVQEDTPLPSIHTFGDKDPALLIVVFHGAEKCFDLLMGDAFAKKLDLAALGAVEAEHTERTALMLATRPLANSLSQTRAFEGLTGVRRS